MADIKISELSIGDWVRHTFYEENLQIKRIDGESERLLVEKGLMSVSCHLDHYEPIPLTQEILEKNAFVKNGEYNEWNIGTWKTPYLLGVSLERPAITIKWNGSSIFIDQAKYVHQLQNALRLAGVEKEIEV